MLGGLKAETALASRSDFDAEFFKNRGPRLGFTAVPKSLEDAVTVPQRYSYDVLYALGDPIANGVPDYRNDGTDDAASFAHRAGDHHDGIQYFGLGPNGKYSPHASDRGLLCMNHEAITPAFLHPTGPTIVGDVRTVPEEVLKEFYVHGVSIIEVVKQKDRKRSSLELGLRLLQFQSSPHHGMGLRAALALQSTDPHADARSNCRARRRARRSWSPSSRPMARRRAARSTTARTATRRGART